MDPVTSSSSPTPKPEAGLKNSAPINIPITPPQNQKTSIEDIAERITKKQKRSWADDFDSDSD